MTEKRIWVLYALLLAETVLSHSNELTRHKRNLVFTPRSSIVQLIIGTGVPVPLEGQQALTVGWVLKAAYGLPNNASYYTTPYVSLQKRSTDQGQRASRFDLYRAMQSSMQMVGGKGCVLRAICEAARTPFRASGLIGQILHIIFTPSTTDEPAEDPGDRLYEAAAMIGTSPEISCTTVFPECKQSLLDVLTVSA